MRICTLYGLGALAALVACGDATKKLGGLGNEVPNGDTAAGSTSASAGSGGGSGGAGGSTSSGGGSTSSGGGSTSTSTSATASGASSSSTGSGMMHPAQYYCDCVGTANDPNIGPACRMCIENVMGPPNMCQSQGAACGADQNGCLAYITCLKTYGYDPAKVYSCIMPWNLLWTTMMDCACDACSVECTPPMQLTCM